MASPRSPPPSHPAFHTFTGSGYLSQTNSPTLSVGSPQLEYDTGTFYNAAPYSPFSTSSTILGSEETKPTFPTALGMQSLSQAPGEADQLRARIHQLEQQLSHARTHLRTRSFTGPVRSLPGWEQRTEARKRLFCSPNRAGNALCAWHDSRRERRMYPPRNAPEGYLNCGCAHEEALFEESLARNGVGSYRPSGDHVRMDPALRRPLLDLLKRRYGYRDGDFEINLATGSWADDEDAQAWEQKLKSKK